MCNEKAINRMNNANLSKKVYHYENKMFLSVYKR